MKRCPTCGRTFTNNTLTDCLNDGTPLVENVPDTVSYYGAPLPASSEPLSPSYPEDDPLDEDDSSDDFAEAPTAAAPIYPETPRFGQPPSYAAPPVIQGDPPPYFAAQARRTRVPWISLVLLGLLGFGIARFALHILHGPQTAPTQDSVPATVSSTTADKMPDLFPGLKLDDTLTQTPDSALRNSLIAAVKGADAAEAKSFSTLSPAPLHSAYAGDALAVEIGEMQDLKKAGTSQEGRMTAQRFKSFQVNPEHTKAQVDLAEKWVTMTRSVTGGEVIHKYPPETNSQIISLTHTEHGWIVENIQFYKL